MVILSFALIIMISAPHLSILDAEPDGYRSTVLDAEGDAVLTLSGEASNRIYVKLAYIPADLQHAFVAIEDERFYEHAGIDLRGIARATWTGIRTGNFSEGASTITQQLLKNNVFTEWTEEKTFLDKVVRKLQEQYLALQLERKVSKSWILENYLNTINLGGGNWGVQTASRYYFHKDVSDLTLSEAAVLAGIAKAPTSYNPAVNPEKNAKRRERVLDKMLKQGYISQAAYDEAMADDVYSRILEMKTSGQGTAEIFSYFEDALIYQVLHDLMGLGYDEDEAWDLIYRGGLTIKSTVDTSLQTIVEEEINNDSNYGSDAQASCVVIDNATGQVRAMVGGRGEKTASLTFNRALASIRQPGSTIKILGEYAAGIEQRLFSLGTVYDDAPYAYSNETEIHNAGGSYSGRIPVRRAIVDSSNIVALKCFQKVGMANVIKSIKKFGITTLTKEDEVEALAIGGTYGGVCNFEMTAAYSALARGGVYIEPVYYTEILDKDGNVLLSRTPATHEVVSRDTAALLSSAMEEAITNGTGTEADFAGMALAGKSGTTSGNRDAWFIGYSPYLTCGIWGGYDDNSAQESSAYVKVLWRSIMSRAHADKAERAFTGRDDLVTCTICTKCGKLAVAGLCDSTVQGDMTRDEYYVAGTQPTAHCTCHVAVEVCDSSGCKANSYCPSTTRRVYLAKGTEGTADAAAVLPESLSDGAAACTDHKSAWESWLDRDDEKENSGGTGSGGNWWNWWNWGSGTGENEPTPTPTPGTSDNTTSWWNWGSGTSENETTTPTPTPAPDASESTDNWWSAYLPEESHSDDQHSRDESVNWWDQFW